MSTHRIAYSRTRAENHPQPARAGTGSRSVTSRGARVMRAWLISSSAVLLGSAGHTLVGAGTAHPMILALCTALGALICLGLLALLERATSIKPGASLQRHALRAGTVAGALTVQTLLHGMFNLAHHSSAQAAPHLTTVHQGHYGQHTLAVPAGTGNLSHAVLEHAHGSMLGVHALAALLSLILLHRSERALAQSLKALHCRGAARWHAAIEPQIPAVLGAPPRVPGNFAVPTLQRRFKLASSRVERGPPAILGTSFA